VAGAGGQSASLPFGVVVLHEPPAVAQVIETADAAHAASPRPILITFASVAGLLAWWVARACAAQAARWMISSSVR